MNDLSEQESAEFGRVLGKLLGVSEIEARDVAGAAIERTMAAASASLGLDYQGLRQVVENLQPGKAFGVLMFEHTWAIPLRAAIRRAGGVPLAQGFVTPEALVMVGEELNAIAEAEQRHRSLRDREERGHPGYAGHAAGGRGDQDGHRR